MRPSVLLEPRRPMGMDGDGDRGVRSDSASGDEVLHSVYEPRDT
jgi:hypothetical protein